jgi:hypothetical protein
MQQGATVSRLQSAVCLGEHHLPAGAFHVAACEQHAEAVAKTTGVDFIGLEQPVEVPMQPMKPLRLGVYQRYYGGNADEGWTRLILEKFDFPFETVMDEVIKAGNLNDKYDVLLFPSDWKQLIVDVSKPDKDNPRGAAMFLRWFGDTIPAAYKSGIGQVGVQALRDFVKAGGRLVAMNNSCDFAAEVCGLKVRNVVAGLPGTEYFTHGSTLHAKVDVNHPLGYGMPEDALIMSWNSPVLQVTDTFHAENYQVVASYPEHDILQSGKLIGEERIAGKSAMLSAKCGEGEAVLIAFAPQHRGQTHGAFKLLFNALM